MQGYYFIVGLIALQISKQQTTISSFQIILYYRMNSLQFWCFMFFSILSTKSADKQEKFFYNT